MNPKPGATQLSRDVHDVLAAVRNAPATVKEPPAEPVEIDAAASIEAIFSLVANGCGRRNGADNARIGFISPLLLAA